MTNQLYINGKDAWTTYKVFLAEDRAGDNRNYSEILTPPPTKERKAVSYPEEDGERLPKTLSPALEARDITLSFALIADNKAAFFAAYKAFLSALKTGDKGWLTLRIVDLDKTIEVYYLSASSYRQLSTFTGGVVAARFDIKFREPKPQF